MQEAADSLRRRLHPRGRLPGGPEAQHPVQRRQAPFRRRQRVYFHFLYRPAAGPAVSEMPKQVGKTFQPFDDLAVLNQAPAAADAAGGVLPDPAAPEEALPGLGVIGQVYRDDGRGKPGPQGLYERLGVGPAGAQRDDRAESVVGPGAEQQFLAERESGVGEELHGHEGLGFRELRGHGFKGLF